MAYRFYYIDGHIIADINGKKALIDTGSPFSLGKEDKLSLNAHRYELLNSKAGVELDNIANSIGCSLDLLIGADILSDHGLFVWLNKREIFFKTMNNLRESDISIDLVMGVPVVEVTISGSKTKAFIDTGAKLSYVSEELIDENDESVGSANDFYPTIGEFTTEKYNLEIGFGSFHSKDDFAVLPSRLDDMVQIAGCKGIIGMDWIRNHCDTSFQIDYKNRRFSAYFSLDPYTYYESEDKKKEYILRLEKIGRAENCSENDLEFVLPKVNKEGFVLGSDYIFKMTSDDILQLDKSREFILNVIKGVHLVEKKYGSFGSPTPTKILSHSLAGEFINHQELYDWIAINGGNYYINSGASYEEDRLNDIQRRNEYFRNVEREKELHRKLDLEREKRNILRMNKTKKKNIKRTEEIIKLKKLEDQDRLINIIISDHPLDYYPAEFSKINIELLDGLSKDNRIMLKEKISKTKRKGAWRKLAKRINN